MLFACFALVVLLSCLVCFCVFVAFVVSFSLSDYTQKEGARVASLPAVLVCSYFVRYKSVYLPAWLS